MSELPKEARPLTRPVEEAMDAGIPVIVLDRKIEGDKYTCFIGADNKKIGRAAGQWIVKQLGGKGKVVELKGLMDQGVLTQDEFDQAKQKLLAG